MCDICGGHNVKYNYNTAKELLELTIKNDELLTSTVGQNEDPCPCTAFCKILRKSNTLKSKKEHGGFFAIRYSFK